jgi:hypothetical protein
MESLLFLFCSLACLSGTVLVDRDASFVHSKLCVASRHSRRMKPYPARYRYPSLRCHYRL